MEPLILEGDVDMDSVDEVLGYLLRQLEAHDELGDDDPVEIDASGVTYLGSHGLHMLMEFRARSGREVVLVGLRDEMRRALELTGLDQIFESRDTGPD